MTFKASKTFHQLQSWITYHNHLKPISWVPLPSSYLWPQFLFRLRACLLSNFGSHSQLWPGFSLLMQCHPFCLTDVRRASCILSRSWIQVTSFLKSGWTMAMEHPEYYSEVPWQLASWTFVFQKAEPDEKKSELVVKLGFSSHSSHR